MGWCHPFLLNRQMHSPETISISWSPQLRNQTMVWLLRGSVIVIEAFITKQYPRFDCKPRTTLELIGVLVDPRPKPISWFGEGIDPPSGLPATLWVSLTTELYPLDSFIKISLACLSVVDSTSCVIPSFSSAFIAINELVSTVSLLEQDNIPNICSNTKLPNKMVSPYNFGSVLESLVTCFVPAGPLILFGSVW